MSKEWMTINECPICGRDICTAWEDFVIHCSKQYEKVHRLEKEIEELKDISRKEWLDYFAHNEEPR